MAFLQGKTPISFLQELCTKRGCTPQYDLIANEGAVHEPTFVFKVTAGEFMGTGKGPSKKKAKHNAALSVLQQMMGAGDAQASVVDQLNAQMVQGEDGDNLGNPVGELQEMTQKRLWPPPSYEFTNEQGPPHAREFICTVRLLNLVQTRPGKSKKVAKRNAAHAMVTMLRKSVTQPEQPHDLDEPADDNIPLPNAEMRSEYMALKEGKSINPLNSQAKIKINQFYHNLRTQPGNGLLNLRTKNLNESSAEEYCTMLEDIGKEHKFEVTYVDLPDLSLTGDWQCFVELQYKKEKKKLVCMGMAGTCGHAHQNAARNAITLLEHMKERQI